MAWEIIDVKVTTGWSDGYIITMRVDFDGKSIHEESRYIPPLGLIERYIFKITMKSRIDEAIEICKCNIEEHYQTWVEKEYCKCMLTKHAKNVLKLDHEMR